MLALLTSLVAQTTTARRVMPWMCLERCNDTATQIQDQLKNFEANKKYLTGVSFELYNLGPNGDLVVNSFSDVGPKISAMGLETFPMISSYPYPPEFLDWMKYVWDNPTPFIDKVIADLKKRKFTGIDVDWEPTSSKATQEDADRYAAFLHTFGNALHKEGLLLSVDVAAWSPIWDIAQIARTSADRLHTMSTYTGNWDSFQKNLAFAVGNVPLAKLGVGLETDNNANSSRPYTREQLQMRFDLIKANKVQEIDIWRAPIDSLWWSFIKEF